MLSHTHWFSSWEVTGPVGSGGAPAGFLQARTKLKTQKKAHNFAVITYTFGYLKIQKMPINLAAIFLVWSPRDFSLQKHRPTLLKRKVRTLYRVLTPP
jgi:hypothetical protein